MSTSLSDRLKGQKGRIESKVEIPRPLENMRIIDLPEGVKILR